MYQVVAEYAGKKNLKPGDLSKAMIAKHGEAACTKEDCKLALRVLIESGRCAYSYLGGSYIQLPPRKRRKPDRPSRGAVNEPASLPRIVVAGLSGESGKTLVSLGLILAAQDRGIRVSAFKKGPDYIDAAWLSWASGRPARNLDTFLMGFERAVSSFARHAVADGLNVVEGNRGLYDGADVHGTHSTAELAKALRAPVLLVLNASKATRTVAASVLGCQRLDPDVLLAGVILNRVGSRRHEQVIRESVESICGIPVLGALPKLRHATLVPERHLGLVTPDEYAERREFERDLLELAEGHIDIDRVLALARAAPAFAPAERSAGALAGGRRLKIGYLKDSAFSFYYPENLEAIEAAGSEVVPISPLAAAGVPDDLDALYIGGGFPETHGAGLARNTGFLRSLRHRASEGLPIYAECGGLMLLSCGILWKGQRFPMAGVLPFEVEVCDAPQGHGYAQLRVDRPNPYFADGLHLKAHEFHYSKIVVKGAPPPTVCAVERGAGCYEGRDGVLIGNVFASYFHLHALATPEWAAGLLRAAGEFSARRPKLQLTFEES